MVNLFVKMSFILRVGKYLVNKFWSSALNFSDWEPKYCKQKYLVWAGIWILGSMLFSLSQSALFRKFFIWEWIKSEG